MENTSGQGKGVAVPPELKGWNWGAFLLNWVWGIGNKTYIALLTFVPVVGMFMPFILGFKGNAWAWRNKSWESIEHFRRVQKKWALWGVIFLVASLILGVASFFYLLTYVTTSDPYVKAVDQVQASKEARNIIGAPIKPGWWVMGNINADGTRGAAELSIPVEGSKQKGTILVKATKDMGKWSLDQLFFQPDGGAATVDLLIVPKPVKAGGQAQPSSTVPGAAGIAAKPAMPSKQPPAPQAIQPKPAASSSPAALKTPAKAAAGEKPPVLADSRGAKKEQQGLSTSKGKVVKKRTAKGKYHSGATRVRGPAKGETPADAARAAINAGNYQGAVKTLTAAIAKNPRESMNYRLRGNAYDNLGKRDDAIDDWKMAASLGDTIIQSYLIFLDIEW